MRSRSVGAVLLALVSLAGCAGPPAGAGVLSGRTDPKAAATPVPAHDPDLVVRVTPSSGPVGTLVHLTATGCPDPGAVSFNSDANDVSARNDASLVHLLTVARTDDRVSGTYQVTRSDLTGGEGLFFVQCGDAVREAPFLVTGPVAASGQCPLHVEDVSAAQARAAFDAVVAYATALDPRLPPAAIRRDSVRLASDDLHGRGGEVMCGADVAARTVVVSTTRTDLLPSASLSQGVYFVSRVAGRLWVWRQAH